MELWERVKLLEEQLKAMTINFDTLYENNCKILNYWFPKLGYEKANSMVYPALGDKRAKVPPNLPSRLFPDLKA